MNILVSGATGFVGRALVSKLDLDGHSITTLVRRHSTLFPGNVKQVIVEDLGKLSTLEPVIAQNDRNRSEQSLYCNTVEEALKETEVLVHTAARVHVMKERAADPLNVFRRVNTEATLILARMAAAAGVKRFIFLSTIKVNGESTGPGLPFSADDDSAPSDPYAISKMEAEQGLMEIAKETGMQVVIIRPPLIYGPGVKGNFASMMRWVAKGIPLPLGRIKNQRSLLALDNLVDFIIRCMDHPKAVNQVFLISDGEDVSTPELVEKIAHATETKARLLPVPVSWMMFMAGLLGRKAVAERLFGSLQIDNRKARELLEWSPAVSMDEQLRKMVEEKSPRRRSG